MERTDRQTGATLNVAPTDGRIIIFRFFDGEPRRKPSSSWNMQRSRISYS